MPSELALVVDAILGLAVAFILGAGVGPLVRRAKAAVTLQPPTENRKDEWAALASDDTSAVNLGRLERCLFFLAFWGDASLIVGGWLAFKVASKWNVWSNLIAVPKTLHGVDELDYLVARRRWGSRVLTGFLVGTLANIVIGFIAAAVARHGREVICLFQTLAC